MRIILYTYRRFLNDMLFFLFLFVLITSCVGDTILEVNKENLFTVYEPSIIKVGNIRKTANNVVNGFTYNGEYKRAQGMAISDGIMYRFFTTGYCRTYDISDIDHPVEIATFPLGSSSSSNHCNSAQFYVEENGEKLLYISGMGGKCYVERITVNSSQLIQTITLDKIGYLQNSVRVNTICSDDGYLWLFGIDNSGDMLVFARAKRPDPQLAEARITKDYILDFWYKSDYKYSESLSQGGKVYYGNLFFVFGSQTTDRHLDIYNIFSHQMELSVDLNSIITEEPEDCDISGNQLIVTVAGGRGYYVLDLLD